MPATNLCLLDEEYTGELLFGNFNEQPVPCDYYIFLNYYNDNGNNIPITHIYDALPGNKGVEDALMPNDENITKYVWWW